MTIEKQLEKIKTQMVKEICDRLQVIVNGYSSARCAVYDMRGKCISFDVLNPSKAYGHDRLHVIAACNLCCNSVYILLASHDDNGYKDYVWTHEKLMNVEELRSVWNEIVHDETMVDNNWRVRAYNPTWLIGDDASKTILDVINQNYDDYKQQIN